MKPRFYIDEAHDEAIIINLLVDTQHDGWNTWLQQRVETLCGRRIERGRESAAADRAMGSEQAPLILAQVECIANEPTTR